MGSSIVEYYNMNINYKLWIYQIGLESYLLYIVLYVETFEESYYPTKGLCFHVDQIDDPEVIN